MRPSLRQVLFRSAAGLDLNFAGGAFSLNNFSTSNPANIPGWSFSRTDTNGTATALDLAGNVIQFATGVPRITNRGILVEEARTNLLLRSQEFDNAAWGKSASGTGSVPTVTPNAAAAPDGTMTADRVVLNINGGTDSLDISVLFQAVATVTSTVYAGSIYLKGTPGESVAFRHAAAAASAIHTFTGGWDFVTLVETAIGAATDFQIFLRGILATSKSATFDIWQADLQAGAFATSPIITTGAAGTRGVDAASIVLPSNVSSFAATYNNGTTATGVVTPGATFDLVTARAWLNGYLQRFRVT